MSSEPLNTFREAAVSDRSLPAGRSLSADARLPADHSLRSDSSLRSGADVSPTVPQYPIESVDRTLQLIELLGRQHEVKLCTVRRHLGIGQSTAHRLMAMLVYRGFAVQNPQTRAYRVGPMLFQLGRLAAGEVDIVARARPVLEWLAAQSGETVHLGVLLGTEVRYLDVVESSSALRVAGRVGQLGRGHATSLGKAMLASLDEAELARRLNDNCLQAETSRTITEPAELLAELSRTRKRGWARNREENQSGVCSVGVAVVHPAHGLVGGLSIAAPKIRSNTATEREHASQLRLAGARLVASIPIDPPFC